MADYTKKLKADLLEQFKESPRINALMETIGDQLKDVSEFYEALRTQRHIAAGVGKQLDGVGDMVVLSRYEALEMVNRAGLGDTITDELYRRYLYYKILKNTNTCTYPDLIKAFRLFWDKPLYYHEDPETPAVMYLETGTLTIFDHVEDLLTTPVIKAAGVGIHIKASVQFPEMDSTLRYGGCFSVCVRQPILEQPDTFDFRSTLYLGGEFGVDACSPVLEAPDNLRFRHNIHVGGPMETAAQFLIPEDTVQPVSTGMSRTGGQFITHTVVPIPEQE